MGLGSMGVNLIGGADKIAAAVQQPGLSNQKALDLVTQTNAIGANIFSNFDSVKGTPGVMPAALTAEGFAVLSAGAILSEDYDGIKAGNFSAAAFKELVGDALTFVGDVTMFSGSILTQSPNVKAQIAGHIMDGVGDGLTVAGIALNRTDQVVQVFSTDWDALKGWVSDEFNDAQTQLNTQFGFQNPTSISTWQSTVSNLTATLNDVEGMVDTSSSNVGAAATPAAAVVANVQNVETSASNFLDGTGLPTENLTATVNNGQITLTTPDNSLPPITTQLSFGSTGPAVAVSANQASDGDNTQLIARPDGSSEEIDSPPEGPPIKIENSPDGGSVIITTEADGTQDYEAHTGPDGSGGMTMFGQVYNDGSSVYTLFDPTTGEQIYNVFYDKNGTLVGENHLADQGVSSDTNYNMYVDSVASTLVGQFIRTLLPNNVPADLAAEAFASTSLGTALGTAGTYTVNGVTYSGPDAFSANFGFALASAGAGIVGNDAGAALDRALGLNVPIGAITLGSASSAGMQYVAALTAEDILGVTKGFGVETTSGVTSVSVDFTTAFENGLAGSVGSLVGGELASLVVPQTATTQIAGAVASTVATGIALIADPELAPLAIFGIAAGSNFLGDLIGAIFGSGYRGRATAEGTMNFSNGQLVAGPVYLDNNGNAAIPNQMVPAVVQDVNSILKSFGGTVTSLQHWAVGQYESNYFSDDGTWPPPASTQYGNPNDAISNAAFNILKSAQFSGANPYMVAMLQKSDATTLQGLVSDLNAAYDYSQYVTNPMGFDVSIALTGSATTLANWNTELARARALGLDKVTPAAGAQTPVATAAITTGTLNTPSMTFIDASSGQQTISLPTPGNGEDSISGFSLTNGDVLDLRSALAASSWKGDIMTIGDFVSTNVAGNNTTLSIDPTGGGRGSAIAILNGTNTSLSDLMSHHAVQFS